MLLVLHLLALWPASSGRHLSPRVVHTRYGALRGVLSSPSNRALQPVEAFLGVRYAGAPVGALRFMPPVTSPHWRGVRLADTLGPACPQRAPFQAQEEEEALRRMPSARLQHLRRLAPYLRNQSEDCLTLNIYAPAYVGGGGGGALPVMVFVHGESFEWNSGNPYDGRLLSSFGNVVVVTVNYRLGVLGFLPSVDGTSRGNYGLLDQVAALHWIRDNIAEFGGDPGNVTVFGQGQGAACVHILMLSPMARGLFRRAILQSGCALSPWAVSRAPDAVSRARRLARLLGCPARDSTALVECLRARPLGELLEPELGRPAHRPGFGPTVDGLLLPREPEALAGRGETELMIGVTGVETDFGYSDREAKAGFESQRRDRTVRTLVRNLYAHHLQEIFLTVVNEYTDWSQPVFRPEDVFRSTRQAVGDATVVAPVHRTALRHPGPTYFYVFEPRETGRELAFVFGAPLVDALAHFADNFSDEEVRLAESVMTYWTRFARFGDPNAGSNPPLDVASGRLESVAWPEFTPSHQRYLSISIPPKARDHYRAHKLSYWLHLIPQLDSADPDATSARHHLLDDHHNLSSYVGTVVEGCAPAPSPASPSAVPGASPAPASPSAPRGAEPREGRALGVTVAVGCSLLALNLVVFAAIYHQRERTARGRHPTEKLYQVSGGEGVEPSFKQPYLLKEVPSSLLLHSFDPGYRTPQAEELKKQPDDTQSRTPPDS